MMRLAIMATRLDYNMVIMRQLCASSTHSVTCYTGPHDNKRLLHYRNPLRLNSAAAPYTLARP